MALGTSTILEVRQPGSNTSCSGGFNPANVSFPIDLTTTNGNAGAPIVSSASYTFVAGDANAYVFVKSGTNWIPGWYLIASVAGGNATLNKACCTQATPGGNGTFGVDYSQQNAAKLTFTDLASAGAGSTFTSAAHPVGKNFVGNLINITSGTNFTTGVFEVISTSGTTATTDRACTTGVGSVGVAALGGAFATPDKACSIMAANLGIKCWIQYNATPYTATVTAANGGGGGTGASLSQQINGYYLVRGDIHMQADGSYTNNANRPVVQVGANSIAAFTLTGFSVIRNIIVDCNQAGGFTASIGIKGASGGWNSAINCKVKNFTSMGFYAPGNSSLACEDCEACYGTSAATYGINFAGSGTIWKCYVHDNACPGVDATAAMLLSSIIVNNTGASSDGVNGNGSFENAMILNNVILASGKNGINGGNTNDAANYLIKNNIIGRNAAYGTRLNLSVACPASSTVDGNVYWFNTTATRGFMDDTGTSNAENIDVTYTNVRDITLTADDAHNPFVRYGISGSTYSATDLASTNGTNATPTVTSATYTFLTSDIGSTLQITTQTGNWLEGTYLIGSISGGGAVLDRPCATAASVTAATYYFNDFRLNNAAGAGASCRKVASPAIPAGYPPTYAGGSPDYGALQHADPAASGGAIKGIYTGGAL